MCVWALILTHSTDHPKNCMFKTCLLIFKDRLLKDVTRFNNSKSIETYNYPVEIYFVPFYYFDEKKKTPKNKCRIKYWWYDAMQSGKGMRNPAIVDKIYTVGLRCRNKNVTNKSTVWTSRYILHFKPGNQEKRHREFFFSRTISCRLVRWTDKIPHTRCLCAVHNNNNHCSNTSFVVVVVCSYLYGVCVCVQVSKRSTWKTKRRIK